MNEDLDWAEIAENRLLEAMLLHAPRLGWTSRALAAAARDIGSTLAEAELLAPNGPRDLAALLARKHDRQCLERLGDIDAASLKIRERIRIGVLTRTDVAMEDEAGVRRWTGFLALPPHIPLALRLTWSSADAIWRWAGDTATDENHYTKRLLLAEILVSTLAVRLSAGHNRAADHLDGRISAVMAFEKWKAGVRPGDLAGRAAVMLGRLRYGGT
jgi:ubiquinone biosynthesis protein COQ9